MFTSISVTKTGIGKEPPRFSSFRTHAAMKWWRYPSINIVFVNFNDVNYCVYLLSLFLLCNFGYSCFLLFYVWHALSHRRDCRSSVAITILLFRLVATTHYFVILIFIMFYNTHRILICYCGVFSNIIVIIIRQFCCYHIYYQHQNCELFLSASSFDSYELWTTSNTWVYRLFVTFMRVSVSNQSTTARDRQQWCVRWRPGHRNQKLPKLWLSFFVDIHA